MLLNGIDDILQKELDILLTPMSDNAEFCNLVQGPLNKVKQNLLADNANNQACGLLPLYICDDISGRWAQAFPACIGLELLKAAAKVFDDIEDTDNSESLATEYGIPLAANTASALLILAEKEFFRLQDHDVDINTVVNLINSINSYIITSCSGQHLDLSLTPEKAASEDVYLKVIAMKSASAVECACYTGALLAGANEELIQTFKIFGYNLGMAFQIANDIKGVNCLKDIKKRKITLPIIYALAQTDGQIHSQLEITFAKHASGPVPDPEKIKTLLFSTGSIQYATIKMELYKQRSKNILVDLERAGMKMKQLQKFME
jgi:geranylgeranyl pyrophosphate synthase